MPSNMDRDKPENSSPDRKKLKTKSSPIPKEIVPDAKTCPYPYVASLLEDPDYKELARKIVNDPAYRRITQQWYLLYSAPTKFDAQAYSTAVEQASNNPQLVANIKCFQSAMIQGPCITKKQIARFRDAHKSNETGTAGCFASRLRNMSDRDTLLKVFEAMTHTAEGDGTTPYDESSLHFMAVFGDAKGLKNALDSGVDVNQLDLVKRTALHAACAFGKLECAEILIANGVDVGALDTMKNTALHYAVVHGMEQCVKLLVESGADKELKNLKGLTPIQIAEATGNKSLNL